MHVCRNAEVSNTFKVDLHALHVDEAIYEVDRTIKALSPFKCKYCQAVCVCLCLHVSLHAGVHVLPCVLMHDKVCTTSIMLQQDLAAMHC